MGIEVKLAKVRLAFPHLFEPDAFEDGQKPKYSCNLIIPKGSANHALLSSTVKKLITETWPDGTPNGFKHCLRDGSEKGRTDGFGDDVIFIVPKNEKAPAVIDRDRSQLSERSDRPYAGCYVNAIVELWAQNTQKYKRVNVSLLGVQFAEDGESFGGSRVARASDFDDLSNEPGAPVTATAEADPLFM